MELLILLASREGQLVTRTEIADRLWASEVFVDTEHGINTAIRTLRYLPDDPQFIQTVVGMGYRFIAPVTTVQKPSSQAVRPGAALVEAASIIAPPKEQAEPSSPRVTAALKEQTGPSPAKGQPTESAGKRPFIRGARLFVR